MNVIDYVILGILVVSMIIGFVKGLLTQLLTVAGIIVVALLTATVSPFVQSWLVNVIAEEGVRAAVAMFATVILLSAAYGVVAWLIGRLLKKIKVIKTLDVIFGGVMGIAVVYLVFAVIFALFTQTSETFLSSLKGLIGDKLETSWFGTHIYSGDKNFFGTWVINDIAQKLIQSFQPAS